MTHPAVILAPVDDFFRAMGLPKPAAQSVLTVHRDTLPAEMRVVVMNYQP